MKSACRPEELTLYAYDFLEGGERKRFETHLDDCARCRTEAGDLLEERTLVAFELAMLPAADPEPLPSRPPRLPGRLVAAAAVVAATVVVLVAGRSVFPPNEAPAPVAPRNDDWTRLADGSRYRALDQAQVRPGIRRLEVDEGALLVDVRFGEEEFEVATPFGSVRSGGGRFAMAVSAAGAFVEVLSGDARLLPTEGDERRLWSGPPEAPPRIHVVEIDPNPELVRRIEELEARLAELLGAAQVPTNAEEAIARHDWAELAEALLGMAPDLRKGRLPEDPAVLGRYAGNLARLKRVARAAGIEPDLESVARDPRTGPRLFSEVVKQAWPDAPAADIEAVEAAAREAMVRYQESAANADTPAARAAAEVQLRQGLERQVEEIEERLGPPAVEVTPVLPGPARETGKLAQPSSSLLAAAGVSATEERVIHGEPEEAARQVARTWAKALAPNAPAGSDLLAIARAWIQDYEDRLAQAPPDLVSALADRLNGRVAAWDIPDSELSRLRAALLDTQSAAERRLLRLLDPADRTRLETSSRPTYFTG